MPKGRRGLGGLARDEVDTTLWLLEWGLWDEEEQRMGLRDLI